MSAITEQAGADGVATITLNRPERHNAFDDALIRELTGALDRAGADANVRVVVLASTGRSFSAGADMGWMQRAANNAEAENLADARALAALLRTLDQAPKPTIALVQGNAYGGGVGLAACCDIVLAAEQATFRLSEVRLGLTPATISPYVVRAIGARQARRYFQTAEPFTAREAQRFGLVHDIAPPDGLPAARDRIVAELLQGAPGALADSKSLIALAQSSPLDDAMIEETSRRIAVRRATQEAREGIAAFLAKRRPAWRGPSA